jgi:hypothetical protein
MHIEFDSSVYRWAAREDSSWFFTDVPEELSGDIREITQPFARGFGAVRVEATIGATTWRTSIFPASDGTYSLPLKRSVRDAERLEDGGRVSVALDILDA